MMQTKRVRALLLSALIIAMLMVAAPLVALDTVIGETGISLNGERQHVRSQETNLGNLVTDVLREASGADIAIYNGGGIREPADMGDITLEQAINILPFENNVVTLEMSGSEVLSVLERGVASYPEVSGSFLQVSGVRLYFNPNRPAFDRIERAYVGGEELDPDGTYTLATNDFLAAGGDEYEELEAATQIDEHEDVDTDLFIRYIQDNSPLFPRVEGRIVVVD